MKPYLNIISLCCIGILAIPEYLQADDPEEDGESCISANFIRQTRIIDDATILFYVTGSKIYRNTLPRQCTGLARAGGFSYRRSTSSLCSNDSIQILEENAGGYREGRSCGLGNFFEITEEDVEFLLDPPQHLPEPNPLPPAEPEEVIEEPDES
jgi:hypothetical protein